MTKKRRYYICAGIFAACVCVALGILAMLPQPGVTKANFRQIKDGMTRAEVEAIIGISPQKILDDGALRIHYWKSADCAALCVMFRGDEAFWKGFEPSTESLRDSIFRWLHLPK